jgi:transcriptional regulator with XRE-family HTH domain
MTITGQQVKAARQLLGRSQFQLAAETHATVGATTIGLFERGKIQPSIRIVLAIQSALEAAGVEFVDGEPGVKLKAKS